MNCRNKVRGSVRARQRAAALLLAGAGVMVAVPATAGETRVFNVEASSPARALQSFAAQSGLQILASGTRLRGRQLNAVTGELSTDTALQQLLAGSGLRYEYVGERAVAVVAINEASGPHAVPVRYGQAAGLSLPQAAPKAGFGLEEIVVTARKVRENLQDTPIAVTAFTGAALEDRQIYDTVKLTQVVPNLQFANNAPLAANNNSSALFIRGIGQTDPLSTVDQGVGLYIDDVYIGQAVGGTMELRDIASMEVLRGPQGTLFGRNTIGGAILLSTKDPGESFGGTARGTYGSFDLRQGFLAVDVPMGPTLRSRFTAGIKKQDGYVLRPDGTDLGDVNNYTFTGKLVWRPVDKLTGKLLFDYAHSDEHGAPLVFAAINPSATFPKVASLEAGCPGMGPAWNSLPSVPNIDDPRCANNFQAAGPFSNHGTDALNSQLRNYGTSLNLVYEATDRLTLKSVTAYRNLKWSGARDADNTPLYILGTDMHSTGWQWSQELDLTYQTRAVTGVVGAYYFKQRSDDVLTVFQNQPVGRLKASDNAKVNNKSWAVFTQWTYRFSEALGLTVGGRYTHDQKGGEPDLFSYANPNAKFIPKRWYVADFSSFTPSASLNYRWSPQAMTYLSYSQGFKGGGWNSHVNQPLTPEQQAVLHPFKEEKAKTYEVGAKFDLFSNTLRLNVALFNSDYTDMQLTFRGPAPNGVAPFVTNAGKASIKGGELELTWAPTADWRIEGSVGSLDATIDKLVVQPLAILPAALKVGNKLPYAPDWQGHIGMAYTAHAPGWSITPRVDVSYQSTTYFDASNTSQIAQLGGYGVVNGQVTFRQEESAPLTITLGVNNAFDRVYRVAGNSSLSTGSGYAETAYARPRVIFATLNYDF